MADPKPIEQVLRRATLHNIDGVTITLPAVGDLIVMKALAGRPQDWADIDTLLNLNPRVNLAVIRKRLRVWCEMIESDEARGQFEQFIAQRRKRKARRS